MCRALLLNPDDYGKLESWWEEHQVADGEVDGASPEEPSHEESNGEDDGNVAAAGMSESTFLTVPGVHAELPPSHPILSIIDLLDLLGPLIFPIYRAALLRKRVLFIARPPLLPSCNFGLPPFYMSSSIYNIQ